MRRPSSPGRVESLRLRAWAGAAWAAPVLSATPGLRVLDVRGGRELLVHRLGARPSRLERVLTEAGV
ncbi:hypothetical protein G5C51_33780 [Streptomyces sp. A7024]|uniref:Uncharacterized protein n=1 Tax=Streptomyces coryli TaxID=1128680 RepID=A0A6G4UCC8_9ACTN|nr:hypothetical protein [Streptomyces coryli]